MTESISVIIPVLDGMPWLDDQLRSLADQRCELPWEVIVADNGSTDDSVKCALEWADRCSAIQHLDASGVPGASGARNLAVSRARGSLLAFCDADDVVAPGWLAGCVAALRRADVVAGTFDFWSLNGAPSASPVTAATRQFRFLPAGLGANLAVTRHAFDTVGGFDELLEVSEDIDFCWRAQLHGLRFAEAPEAVVAKRDRDSQAVLFRRSIAYGRSGTALYRRFRSAGMHRDVRGALKTWAWLLVRLPSVGSDVERREWLRAAGMRMGRLLGSLEQGVFFP